jgi:DNA-binding LacI/PurR family transcriptional regulator
LGHTKIVHVDGGKSPGATDRRASYRTTMRRSGLTPLIVPAGPTENDGSLAAKHLIDTYPEVTAAFASNDRSAVGFLDTIRQSRQVPTDLSVIGYDNSTIAALSHINLTTIAQNTPALAEATIHQAHLRATTPEHTTPKPIAPRLVLRTTTGSRS